MKEYTITSEFVDRETGNRKKPGDTITVDDDRAAQLRAAGVIGKEVTASTTPDENGLIALGGGYYQLPDGNKVQGKDKALEALKALQELKQAEGGTGDGAPSGNAASQ
ncbi:hypothetical protein AAC03nite_28160 [Alicyclobacillus acidoterrestris]|nr:hypothetical protein AAC03nite_28160 [Alicyclobacillus acidoterrestris]